MSRNNQTELGFPLNARPSHFLDLLGQVQNLQGTTCASFFFPKARSSFVALALTVEWSLSLRMLFPLTKDSSKKSFNGMMSRWSLAVSKIRSVKSVTVRDHMSDNNQSQVIPGWDSPID